MLLSPGSPLKTVEWRSRAVGLTLTRLPQIVSPPLKFMGGYEIKFTPPKPRQSLTVRCSDKELLVEGPSSARIVGNMIIFHPEPVPIEKADIVVSIKPVGVESPIVIERFLHPPRQRKANQYVAGFG
jgi:hypothetical protein